MKSYIWFLLVVPALALGSGLCRGTPEVPLDPVKGTVLILHTERTMEGDIQRKGDFYCIRRGPAEVTIPADRVLRLCQDWDDAFAFMKSRAQLGDADERLRLAKWCDINNLPECALAEVEAAHSMRPMHKETELLRKILKGRVDSLASSSSRPPPETVPAPAVPQIEVAGDSLAVFANKIQPILLNTCVSCHSAGKGGDFQLYRAHEGGQRAATQRNLATAVAFVNLEHPARSPLLIKAVSVHGNLVQPAIRSRESTLYLPLQEWVETLVASNPNLRDQRWSPRALTANQAAAVEPTPRTSFSSPRKESVSEAPTALATKGPKDDPVRSGTDFASGGQVISSSRPRLDTSEKVVAAPKTMPPANPTRPAPTPPMRLTFPEATAGVTPEPITERPMPQPPPRPSPILGGLTPAQFPEPAGLPSATNKETRPEVRTDAPLTTAAAPPNFQRAAFPMEVAPPQGVPAQPTPPAPALPSATASPTAPPAANLPPPATGKDPYDPDVFNRQMHPQR